MYSKIALNKFFVTVRYFITVAVRYKIIKKGDS